MGKPLLSVKGVWREYIAGDQAIAALRGVDLTINAGEFVAIIGQSGSGKSTLMNILGCLDRPTRGTYEVSGRDTSTLTPDELSALRREHFGFIFQRYHLLSDLDARGNVEVPAIYAGWSSSKRKTRAEALLKRLGLESRLHNRPNQLSGGQQQRVSVARALMNGGEIILADEPTGALDSRSGEEMLRILDELSNEGHTIILVTHDSKVAAHAHRIIEIRDGEVIDDRLTENANKERKVRELSSIDIKESWTAWLDRLGDAFRMAILAMNAHKLRTFLTMLGIIIGIASVVAIFALGNGSRKAILDEIAASGSNTIQVYPGEFAGDPRAAAIKTLVVDDIEALASQPYSEAVSPIVGSDILLRYSNQTATANLQGVGDQFFRVKNVKLAKGRLFSADDVKNYGQGVVIGDETAKQLFPREEPIGKVIFIGSVPLTVIGVAAPTQGSPFGTSTGLLVIAPYTTVMNRILHQQDVNSIVVRMNDNSSASLVTDAMDKILMVGHGIQPEGTKDYYFVSSEAVRIAKERAALIQNLLIGAVGAISLLVGGIGVMNIMLVSVSERTREIGVRSAIGARRSDIMSQFVIEAVMVCLIGGAFGVGLALLVGFIFSKLDVPFVMLFTTGSIVGAFLTASLIGLVFGWLPARNAAMLDPVDALARD